MSWVAEAKAMARASEPMTQTSRGWPETAERDKPRPTSATWLTRIQPRLRPRKGSGYASMEGDHSSLKVQGAWARLNRPMTLMSTPARAIQAGRAIQTKPRGRPEEKERRTTERSRQLPATARRLCQVVGFLEIIPGRRPPAASITSGPVGRGLYYEVHEPPGPLRPRHDPGPPRRPCPRRRPHRALRGARHARGRGQSHPRSRGRRLLQLQRVPRQYPPAAPPRPAHRPR